MVWNSDTPLYIDVADDLSRVDTVMTRLLQERTMWDEFIADPNGVLVRLGLHPETSPEINDRVNQIFWLTISDPEIMRILGRHYSEFRPEREEEIQRFFLAGLSEGEIRHDPDYDLQALNSIFQDTDVLNSLLRRSLILVNEAGLTQQRYTGDEINAYVDAVSEAILAGVPMQEFPRLEMWDDQHGIGAPFGNPMFFEVGSMVTAFVGAQVGAYVTALLEVGFWGVAIEQSRLPGLEDDPDTVRRLAIAGRALDLGAEILVHAQNFRRDINP